MDLVKSESKWPVRYRVEKFSKLDGLCAKVRLHHAPDFCHEMIKNVDGTNTGKIAPCARMGIESALACTGAKFVKSICVPQ
jgi:hypothetical protein